MLFDNDGTLIDGFNLHKMAFAVGLQKVYNIDAHKINVDTINYHGMTDQQILTELLKTSGVSSETIDSLMSQCIKVMGDYYEKNIASCKCIGIFYSNSKGSKAVV